jgi:hypothetical protein
MQKGFMAMTINNNKEDLKQICHKLVNNKGALAMMCGKD